MRAARADERRRRRHPLREPAAVRRRTRTSTRYPRDLDGDRAVAERRGRRRALRARRSTRCTRSRRAHHGARRRAHRRPVRREPARPLRRRHHRRRQAVHHRRPVPRPTSARRTPSSSRWCGAWPPTSTCRSRWSAARSCASPTAWPCRAATPTSTPTSRRPRTVLVARAACRRPTRWSRGERDAGAVARRRRRRRRAPSRWSELDYAEVVDAATLAAGRRASTATRWSRSPRCVGTTRLIDNVTISFDGDAVARRPRRARRTAGSRRRPRCTGA